MRNLKPFKITYIKTGLLACFLVFLTSCQPKKPSTKQKSKDSTSSKVITPEFQSILDSAKVTGSILIYDLEDKRYYSNDFKWTENGYLPASTFKITNAIIALETGVIKNDSSVFKWNGKERRLKTWERDLTFTEAFHASCVPCFQELAQKIGPEKMNLYLKKLNYGAMQVSASNIDLFWLAGDSKINQLEQIDFLKRLYQSQLPISKRTENIIKRMMLINENDGYTISGKTGWSIRNGHNNGWFVGWLKTANKVYFFATNINPKQQFNMSLFPVIRKSITQQAFKELGIIKN
ncbi:beta-lactamase [Polaribacter pacificus]|uniref:beta-lactamase n=1 Tax=Polaribacter pacificus TaxID=1775173 RepID=A0A917MGL6_9FLAO|nr:class D beta-lactamase [Polaribacter pacificus]GGH00781.1 beta-lactamase [Polaribacter pacificus]